MNTENIKVFNASLGQEILPVSSWFRVSPSTSITIVKSVRTLTLSNFYDAEVASETFTSYTTKKLGNGIESFTISR